MHRRRISLATAVALALAAAGLAPSALAGTASVDGSTLRYVPDPQGDPAEGPDHGGGIELHIFQDASSYQFATSGNELNPGPGCSTTTSYIPGLAPLAVSCNAAGVTKVVVDLPFGVLYSSLEDAQGQHGLRTPELINAFPQASTNLIHGGNGNDTINASAGSERIFGEGGRDAINAGAGDDTVYIHDGQPDTVRCGPGHDRVVNMDPVDVVSSDCEVGRRKDRHPPSVKVGFASGQTVSGVASNGLHARMTCSEPCAAKLRVLLGKSVLGSRKLKLPAGERTEVAIPLTGGGKSKLTHEGAGARLTFKASVTDASGNTRKVTRRLALGG